MRRDAQRLLREETQAGGARSGREARGGGQASPPRTGDLIMKPRRLALVDKSSQKYPFAAITAAAQALQIQLDRDFTPSWGVKASILAFDRGEKIPPGYWPLRIVDQPVGGLGIHLDRNHHPYAEIMAADDWSITASHEMVE